jgi:hypothetical protein
MTKESDGRQQVTSHVFLHVWVQMVSVNATHSLLRAPGVLYTKVVAMVQAPMLKAGSASHCNHTHESEMAVESGRFLSWVVGQRVSAPRSGVRMSTVSNIYFRASVPSA